jgi:CubicO group peptidase (beta-lactamase class C family)
MLGLAAAESMKMPFEDAMEQRLFPKLGMRNSYINLPANKMHLHAQGYNKQDSPVRVFLHRAQGAEQPAGLVAAVPLDVFAQVEAGDAQRGHCIDRTDPV